MIILPAILRIYPGTGNGGWRHNTIHNVDVPSNRVNILRGKRAASSKANKNHKSSNMVMELNRYIKQKDPAFRSDTSNVET